MRQDQNEGAIKRRRDDGIILRRERAEERERGWAGVGQWKTAEEIGTGEDRGGDKCTS